MRRPKPRNFFIHPSARPTKHEKCSFNFNGYQVDFGREKRGVTTVYWAKVQIGFEQLLIEETMFRACIDKMRARLALLPRGKSPDRTI
jgi:hypothetical protein